jgi:hypothetical protein
MSLASIPLLQALPVQQLNVDPRLGGRVEAQILMNNNSIGTTLVPHDTYTVKVLDSANVQSGHIFHEHTNGTTNEKTVYLQYDKTLKHLSVPQAQRFLSPNHDVSGALAVSGNATILGNLTVGGSITPASTTFNNATATNLTVLNTLDLAQNNAEFLKTNALGVVEAGVFSTVSVGSALTANTALTALAVAPLANLTATDINNTNLTSINANITNLSAFSLTLADDLKLPLISADFLKTSNNGFVQTGNFANVQVGTALTALDVAPLANLTATNIVNTNLTSLSANVSNLVVDDTVVINGADTLVDFFNIAEYTNWTVPADPSKNKYIVGNYGRLSLDPTFGQSALLVEPNSVAGSRGRVIATDLSSQFCTIAGTRGDYDINGTSQLSNLLPKCAVLGAIMPGSSTADGAFVALCDGDSASSSANAGYAVAVNNSNSGTGFDKGIDLRQRQLISGTPVNLDYDDCDIHFNSDAKIKSFGSARKLELDAVLSLEGAPPTGVSQAVDVERDIINATTGGHFVQGIFAKVNLNDEFGKNATLGDPNTVQVIRARISGDDPEAEFTNVSAVRADWNCKGTTLATSDIFPKACVLGSVQPQTSTCKSVFQAYLEGDTGTSNADSAFGVITKNSTAGTNFNYILDAVNNNVITGAEVPILPAVADIRLSNGLLLKSVADAITDGDATALPAGAVVLTSNATGLGRMFISNGSILKQLAFATP